MAVEVDNRTGERVDEAALAGVAEAVVEDCGLGDAEAAIVLVGADEMRALNRTHRAVDAETDVLAFPIDEADDLPTGLPRLLGDVVVCLPVAAAPGRRGRDRRRPGAGHARRARHAAPRRARPRDGRRRDAAAPGRARRAAGRGGVARFLTPRQSTPPGGGGRGRGSAFLTALNYAFEGIIHVVRTERNMRIHFVGDGGRAALRAHPRREQGGAARADLRVHPRAGRGDGEHGGRGGHRRGDVELRPARQDRQGRRRRAPCW